jgi:hypothetical protein
VIIDLVPEKDDVLSRISANKFQDGDLHAEGFLVSALRNTSEDMKDVELVRRRYSDTIATIETSQPNFYTPTLARHWNKLPLERSNKFGEDGDFQPKITSREAQK